MWESRQLPRTPPSPSPGQPWSCPASFPDSQALTSFATFCCCAHAAYPTQFSNSTSLGFLLGQVPARPSSQHILWTGSGFLEPQTACSERSLILPILFPVPKCRAVSSMLKEKKKTKHWGWGHWTVGSMAKYIDFLEPWRLIIISNSGSW